MATALAADGGTLRSGGPRYGPSGGAAKAHGAAGPAARVKAQPVGEKTYLESVSDYIQDYIPLPIPTVVKALNNTTSQAKASQDEQEQVLWVQLDTGDDGDVPVRHNCPRGNRVYLTLGYANGYQVWDVTDGENAREIVSRRTGPIKQHCTRVLLSPVTRPGSPSWDKFAAQRPLMTVVAVDDALATSNAAANGAPAGAAGNGAVARSSVRVLSLLSHECVSTLRFRSEIHSVHCNRLVVAIASRESIYVFKADTLENAFSVNGCYPSTGPVVNPFALGSRWIAYAASQPSPSPRPAEIARAQTQTVMDLAKDVAKDIASGLYYLGDLGIQRVSSYLNGPGAEGQQQQAQPGQPAVPLAQPAAPQVPQPALVSAQGGQAPSGFHDEASMSADGYPSSSDDRSAGTVVIRDVVSRKVVAHFRAMRHEISAIAFDPSGQLLVTASNMGHGFNVFQILPPHMSARHGTAPALSSHSAASKPSQDAHGTNGAQGTASGVAADGGAGGRNAGWAHTGEMTIVRHIYKLHRGITNAVVVDISFANDSRWVALSTSRGTTHVFAISPSGGPVDVSTHTAPTVPNESRRFTSAGLEEVMSQPPPDLVSLQAIARIRSPCVPPSAPTPNATDDPRVQQQMHAVAAAIAGMGGASLAPVAVRFVPAMVGCPASSWSAPYVAAPVSGEERQHHSPDAQAGSQTVLVACAEKGILQQYRIIPHPPVQRTADQSVLEATARALKEWTLGRTSSWPETEVSVRRASPAAAKASQARHVNGHANGHSNGNGSSKAAGEERRWLAGVEIATHTPLHRPLWMGPQFTFKTYQPHETATLSMGHMAFGDDGDYREETLERAINGNGAILAHHRGTPEDALVIPLRLADAKMSDTPPSPHAMDEEDIMLSLSKAMHTTMRPRAISNGAAAAHALYNGRSADGVSFDSGAVGIRARPAHYGFGAASTVGGLRPDSASGGAAHGLHPASDDGSDLEFVDDAADDVDDEDWGQTAFPNAFDDLDDDDAVAGPCEDADGM